MSFWQKSLFEVLISLLAIRLVFCRWEFSLTQRFYHKSSFATFFLDADPYTEAKMTYYQKNV